MHGGLTMRPPLARGVQIPVCRCAANVEGPLGEGLFRNICYHQASHDDIGTVSALQGGEGDVPF
jgi:hypothetical protein